MNMRRPRLDPTAAVTRRQVALGLGVTCLVVPAVGSAQQPAPDDWDILPSDADQGPVIEQASTSPSPAPQVRPGAMSAAPSHLQLKPSPAGETAVWSYHGTVPGPLLRIKQGEPFRLSLTNNLVQPTTLHWHGVQVPNPMDGVAGLTQAAIEPRSSFDIAFPTPDAGTSWYHPLVPASAAEQTERGLYGVLIVEETKPPLVDHDVIFVMDDWALDPDSQLSASFNQPAELALRGRLGNWLTVNSKEPPERLTVRPGAHVRLRAINAANARPMTLRFEGLKPHVIAVDSQPSEVFSPARDSISLLPGSRHDFILEAPPGPGQTGAVLLTLGPGVPLLVLSTEGSPSALSGAEVKPLPRNRLPEVIPLQSAARAELVIDGGVDPASVKPGTQPSASDTRRIWTINKVAWIDAERKPVLSVKSGRPVSLGFINHTPYLQVLHLHGHHARLLHNFDDGWEPYFLDTVPVQPNGTARIAFIAGAPGRWMIGSAILERLGSGLACWFEVT